MASQLYKGLDPLATTAPPVVNNLNSTSTTSALSAYQGKVLKDMLDVQDITSQITLNSTYIDTSGSNTALKAYKFGKMVMVCVNGLSLKSAISGTVSIMSGLPIPKDVLNVGLKNFIAGTTSVDGWNTSRYRINASGELQLWYDNVPQNAIPFGQFFYFTN